MTGKVDPKYRYNFENIRDIFESFAVVASVDDFEDEFEIDEYTRNISHSSCCGWSIFFLKLVLDESKKNTDITLQIVKNAVQNILKTIDYTTISEHKLDLIEEPIITQTMSFHEVFLAILSHIYTKNTNYWCVFDSKTGDILRACQPYVKITRKSTKADIYFHYRGHVFLAVNVNESQQIRDLIEITKTNSNFGIFNKLSDLNKYIDEKTESGLLYEHDPNRIFKNSEYDSATSSAAIIAEEVDVLMGKYYRDNPQQDRKTPPGGRKIRKTESLGNDDTFLQIAKKISDGLNSVAYQVANLK